MDAPRTVMRMGSGSDEQAAALDLLMRTPLDRLEEAVQALKALRPADEVRKAMVERIARAPLAEFDTLKHIYLRYCGNPSQ